MSAAYVWRRRVARWVMVLTGLWVTLFMMSSSNGWAQEGTAFPNLILADDFESIDAGVMPRTPPPNSRFTEFGYKDGQYLVATIPGNTGITNSARLDPLGTHYRIQVDATVVEAGGAYGSAGLGVLRSNDGYIRFSCSTSGRCLFDRPHMVNQQITSQELGRAPEPIPGLNLGVGAMNTLSIIVEGNKFTGLVNGNPVMTVEDGTYNDGGIALVALGPPTDRTVVMFDNLTVYGP